MKLCKKSRESWRETTNTTKPAATTTPNMITVNGRDKRRLKSFKINDQSTFLYTFQTEYFSYFIYNDVTYDISSKYFEYRGNIAYMDDGEDRAVHMPLICNQVRYHDTFNELYTYRKFPHIVSVWYSVSHEILYAAFTDGFSSTSALCWFHFIESKVNPQGAVVLVLHESKIYSILEMGNYICLLCDDNSAPVPRSVIKRYVWMNGSYDVLASVDQFSFQRKVEGLYALSVGEREMFFTADRSRGTLTFYTIREDRKTTRTKYITRKESFKQRPKKITVKPYTLASPSSSSSAISVVVAVLFVVLYLYVLKLATSGILFPLFDWLL